MADAIKGKIAREVLEVGCWVNFVFSGLVGNIIVAVLWAIYSLEIGISAPDIAHMIHEQALPANPPHDGLKFTGKQFKDNLLSYQKSARAFNVFGWLMFSFAILNALNVFLGIIGYVVTKWMTSEALVAAVVPTWGASLIPLVIGWAAPATVAVVGLLQTLSFAGYLISGVMIRAYAAIVYLKHDFYCNGEESGDAPWMLPGAPAVTPSPPPTMPPIGTPNAECAVPDYTQKQPKTWISESLCCRDQNNLFCCAFDAPYDWGLRRALTHSNTVPFYNQQRQIRDAPKEDVITRMRYITQPLYVNIDKHLYAEKRNPSEYFDMELWILVLGVLLVAAYGFILWRQISLYKGLILTGEGEMAEEAAMDAESAAAGVAKDVAKNVGKDAIEGIVKSLSNLGTPDEDESKTDRRVNYRSVFIRRRVRL